MDPNPTFLNRSPLPPHDLRLSTEEHPCLESEYGTVQLSLATGDFSGKHGSSTRRRREAPRCISKRGDCSLQFKNVPKQNWRFASDLFTTLLESQWRWTLFVFCLTYFGSWFIFALLWYLILYLHGDLTNFGVTAWRPCVSDIPNFTTAFLFSVETQHTTGYGFYRLGDECPEAILLLCLQSIVGVILEGLMVGLVFVKISRAKKRTKTIMFSRQAVICQRDGQLCLMFRVGDMRTRSHLLQATIRAQLVRNKVTLEGETVQWYQEELKIQGQEEKPGKLLLFWPTTIVHKIDKSSPLYSISPADLTVHNTSFQLIVALQGIVDSTGLTVQARSSYIPSEISWGSRFAQLQSTKTYHSGEQVLDFSKFHEIYPSSTIMMSAADMDAGLRMTL